MTKLILSLNLLFLSLLFSTPLLAQTTPQMQPGNAQINLGNKQPPGMGIKAIGNPNATVGNIVSNFILILFIAGGLAVLVYFVWGAFDWITAGGDKEKIAGARRKIINAFIGLTLLALSYFLVSLVGQIVGYNPLNTPPLPKLDQAPTGPTP